MTLRPLSKPTILGIPSTISAGLDGDGWAPMPRCDCADFNRVVSLELRADLSTILDLALREPRAGEIVAVVERVARAAAAERLRPEKMLVCVKALWLERRKVSTGFWSAADETWMTLVRTMIEAYYVALVEEEPARHLK